MAKRKSITTRTTLDPGLWEKVVRGDIKAIELAALPFISSQNQSERDFWAIRCPRYYTQEAWHLGEKLAVLALMVAPRGDDPSHTVSHLLGSVARAQVERGARTAGEHAVILGFWNTIGALAHRGVRHTQNNATAWADHVDARHKRYEAAETARADRISQRCRRAALIGAAKRWAVQQEARS